MGVEIGTSLSASDRKPRQRVLQNLLHAEKLQDRLIHRRVKAKASLIGTDCGIELYTVAEVDMIFPLIIGPGHPKAHNPLRLHKSLKEGIPPVEILIGIHNRSEGIQDPLCGLQKFRLIGMFFLEHLIDFIDIGHGSSSFFSPVSPSFAYACDPALKALLPRSASGSGYRAL